MSGRPAEPFILALRELRDRLRRGAVPLDTRLAAAELAAELGFSATPVREALSRLAGEGLLEDRRGQGFFVRRLGRTDIVQLYRLNQAHLAIALDGAPVGDETLPGAPAADPVEDAVAAVEQLFARWTSAAGGRALAQSLARVQAQLAPIRRLEHRLIPDLAAEATGLAGAEAPRERRVAVRIFHARRVRLAGRLAELLERRAV